MKTILVTLLISSLMTAYWSLQASNTILAPYLVPPELESPLNTIFSDKHFYDAFIHSRKKELAALRCTLYQTSWGNVVIEHPQIPGYLIKSEKPFQNKCWKRVLYADEIKKAIAGQDHMLVSTEYVYHYPNHSFEPSSANYCVVSKKLDLQDVTLASFLAGRPELVQELQTVMRTVGFWDPNLEENIRITQDNKIAFIDTEPYTNDLNPVIQTILNLIFFHGKAPGEVTAMKLRTLVEKARNSGQEHLTESYDANKAQLYALKGHITVQSTIAVSPAT
jgi:hypothetical protein